MSLVALPQPIRRTLTLNLQPTSKHILNPEFTLLYQFHAQKALFKVPKSCNIDFWIENDLPAPLEPFRKFIRFGGSPLSLKEPYPTLEVGWRFKVSVRLIG